MNQKERIGEAQKLFDLLYGGVTANKYGYLWTFPAKKTYSFDVLNAESRLKMAEKAIWLNDELEQNVFFGVVLTDTKLDEYHRVSIKGEYPPVLQPAIWADLDIKGENHKADNLPPDAKTAISLLDTILKFLDILLNLYCSVSDFFLWYGLYIICSLLFRISKLSLLVLKR